MGVARDWHPWCSGSWRRCGIEPGGAGAAFEICIARHAYVRQELGAAWGQYLGTCPSAHACPSASLSLKTPAAQCRHSSTLQEAYAEAEAELFGSKKKGKKRKGGADAEEQVRRRCGGASKAEVYTACWSWCRQCLYKHSWPW